MPNDEVVARPDARRPRGTPAVWVGLLGPVSLQVEGRDVPLGGTRRKSALALLSLAGRPGMAATSLASAMFGELVNDRSLNTLQVHLSQLRGQLAPYQGALARVGPNYRLDSDLVATDTEALERALERWRLGQPEAVPSLRAAVRARRGELCADLPDLQELVPARARYEQLYLDAQEVLFDAELQAGAGPHLPERIEAVLESAPLRERLWAQLMLALYAVGRQSAALDAYRRARRVLADEVGVEPGAALRELEVQILRHSDTVQRAVPALAATGAHALVWLDPSGRPRSVSLLPGREVSLGRDRQCTIQLSWDPSVSRRHAVLTLVDGQCLVRDLGSRNGTFIGDQLVRAPAVLTPRATLRAGNSVLFLRGPVPRSDSRAITRVDGPDRPG
jgi:DNA-binding SARP family transcriptional activator